MNHGLFYSQKKERSYEASSEVNRTPTSTQRLNGLLASYQAVTTVCPLTLPSTAAPGMDAGRAYNTWPLMGGRVVPEEYWDEQLGLSPLRNMFENTAAVQFNHR